jgi:hypothetical protein
MTMLLLLLCCSNLQVLLQYRTLRNYRTLMYLLPRLLEKLLFAAVVLSLYWGKVGVLHTRCNLSHYKLIRHTQVRIAPRDSGRCRSCCFRQCCCSSTGAR